MDISPGGFNLLLIATGLLLISYRQFLGKLLIIFSLLAQLLIKPPQIQYSVLHSYESLKTHSAAIIVLGGGDSLAVEYKNKRVPDESSFMRLHYAVFLQQQLKLPIIVSADVSNDCNLSLSHYLKINLQKGWFIYV